MRQNLSTSLGARALVLFALSGAARATVSAQLAAPTHVSIVPSHARVDLVESSAAAMSARQPGVFFTINDSGNQPVLFAMDTLGAARGAWLVRGAANVDWESAAVGPCGTPSNAAIPLRGTAGCVYIGDTGDNDARHLTREIYRVPEPIAGGLARGGNASIVAEKLKYVYADGPHDVEAMYVAPNGDIFFITKRRLKDAGGRPRQALVFRLAPATWTQKGRNVAELVDSLPIIPGSTPFREISDASLSQDGRHLAVRTYTELYVFATDAATGRVQHAVAPSVCNLEPLGEPQGEGVTWVDNRGRFLFTSEGQTEPVRLADCPLPVK